MSEDYFEAEGASAVREGDVVMARSGEGTIGKVALMPAGVRGVCADFTMRIRLDPAAWDRRSVFYFLMSDFFQELVHGEKEGLGKNMNILPVQLRALPVLAPPADEQRRVADDIKAHLDRFARDRAALAGIRAEMDATLTAAVRQHP